MIKFDPTGSRPWWWWFLFVPWVLWLCWQCLTGQWFSVLTAITIFLIFDYFRSWALSKVKKEDRS